MSTSNLNRIAQQQDKFLIGMRASMSLRENTTQALWQSFMPRRNEVQNSVGEALYSVQNFTGLGGLEHFNPSTIFEKWAAREVSSGDVVPEGMELFILHGGHYAVFDNIGPPSEFPKTMNFIFSEWLPNSQWQLDDREHFEILLPGWRADDPKAQEEVWIPIK